MHVSVGGMPANDETSTDVWQYRQSIPSSPAWCSWLNWHRLVDRHVLARHVRRPEDRVDHAQEPDREEHGAEDRDARERVHARMKNLRHRRTLPATPVEPFRPTTARPHLAKPFPTPPGPCPSQSRRPRTRAAVVDRGQCRRRGLRPLPRPAGRHDPVGRREASPRPSVVFRKTQTDCSRPDSR